MNLEEYAAKQHVLLPAAVPIPKGIVCRTPEEAAAAVASIGPSVIKAQVPTGKRGKSGGIKMADKPEEGAAAAREILGMTIGGSRVELDDAAIGDRRLDRHGIQHPGKVEIGGVLRHAAHFARTIHPRRAATNWRNGRSFLCCRHVRSFGGISPSPQFAARA